MDVLNINSGQLRITDQGDIFVNYNQVYGQSMMDSRIWGNTTDLRQKVIVLEQQNHALTETLEKTNKRFIALLHIMYNSNLIKDIEDVDKMLEDMNDAGKLMDKLVEIGEQNDASVR